MKPTFPASPRVWGALSVVIFLGILFCTLWPFKLSPANNIRWSPSGWVAFGHGGIMFTTVPLTFDSSDPGNGCAVELLLRPTDLDSNGTILGTYRPGNPKQFVVRHWHEGLLVTHDRVGPGGFKRQKFDLGHAFQADKPTLLTMSSGPEGTVVYLDGKKAQTFPHFVITRQQLSGQFVLGNSATDFAPWIGELRGVALYSKELTAPEALEHYNEWITPGSRPDLTAAVARYDFKELHDSEVPNEVAGGPGLEVPKVLRIPDKVMLKSPLQEYRDDGQFRKDFIVNVIGFIPMGFLLCGYWTLTKNPRFAFVGAVLFCAMFSFSIEVAQAFIPNRGSGWTDVISNTLGGIVGAVLAQAWFKLSQLWQKKAL